MLVCRHADVGSCQHVFFSELCCQSQRAEGSLVVGLASLLITS